MRKVLIVCVNYNSYKELQSFIKSIDESLYDVSDVLVDVIIADNSSKYQEYEYTPQNKLLSIEHRKSDNNGYLGTAQKIINTIDDICQYDYVAISNVDIVVSNNFFRILSQIELDDNIGWVATSIKSELIGRDKNPSVLKRYSKRKLWLLKLTYNSIILPLYEKLYYQKKTGAVEYGEMDIYAGHGSFIMLTKAFYQRNKKLNYPMFLYGEELYLAELNRKSNLRVRYIPSLVIKDFEHVSTSQLRRSSYYEYNRNAIDYILKVFY